MEYAAELIYLGSRSGSTFYVENNEASLTLYWRGYSETITDFVTQTVQSILNMNKATSASHLVYSFENAKSWLIKDLEGATYAKSYR